MSLADFDGNVLWRVFHRQKLLAGIGQESFKSLNLKYVTRTIYSVYSGVSMGNNLIEEQGKKNLVKRLPECREGYGNDTEEKNDTLLITSTTVVLARHSIPL